MVNDFMVTETETYILDLQQHKCLCLIPMLEATKKFTYTITSAMEQFGEKLKFTPILN
jgi:hypothetical protein